MPIPLLFWGAMALGTALGIGGTVATTDAAEDIGDAMSDGANSMNSLMTTTAIVGVAYLAYKHRADIQKFIGGK